MDNYSKQERTWKHNLQNENMSCDKPRKTSVFWLLVSIVSMTYGLIAFCAYLRNNDGCTPFNCTLYDAGDMFGVVGRDLKFNKIDKIHDYDSLQATLYYYVESKSLAVKLRKICVAEQSETYYTKEAKDEAFYSILALVIGLFLFVGQISHSQNNQKDAHNECSSNDADASKVDYSSSSKTTEDANAGTSAESSHNSGHVGEKTPNQKRNTDAEQSQKQGLGKHLLFFLVFGFITIRSVKMMTHHPSQSGGAILFFVGFVGAIIAFVKLFQGNNGKQNLSQTQNSVGGNTASEDEVTDDDFVPEDAEPVSFEPPQPPKKKVLLYGDDNYEYKKPNDYAIYHRGNKYVLAVAFDIYNDTNYHYFVLDDMEAMMDFDKFSHFASEIRDCPYNYISREVQNEEILVDAY